VVGGIKKQFPSEFCKVISSFFLHSARLTYLPVLPFTPFISVLVSAHPTSLQTYANGLRFVLTILGGTIAVMGSRVIGYTSAGALGCVTTAFIARIGWRREETRLTPQQLQAQQIVSAFWGIGATVALLLLSLLSGQEKCSLAIVPFFMSVPLQL